MNDFKKPLEIFSSLRRKQKLEKELTKEELLELILEVENSLNFVSSTIYDNPFYPIAPTTIDNEKHWVKNTSTYRLIDKKKRKQLFENGFTILNREILEKKSLVDIFGPLEISAENLILDNDYGLLLLPDGSKKKNFYLSVSELYRYVDHYPFLESQFSNIFSIGAIRAHSVLNNKIDFRPIEVEVKNKDELNSLISNLESKLSNQNSRLKLWFRGQDTDYLLNKVEDKLLPHVPWRSSVDSSLVPSLYRSSKHISNDLKDYAQKVAEISELETALNNFLQIPKFKKKQDELESIKDYFKDSVWEDSNSLFSFTHVKDDKESEIHDYNPIYRALQTSLFLQHYGVPTNILDITKDIDVALFFAQTQYQNGEYVKIKQVKDSVIYVFLLDPITDKFIDSSELLEGFGVQRPLRQKCGVITGASLVHQNYYSRFISMKIKLCNNIEFNEELTGEFLFPKRENDEIIDFLKEYVKTNDLKKVNAF
ncbi:MAG: FRG domain-containing protein [Bacteroidales bacterium]|nr:FRG domain-containing protein [Bacteroidales bacterium]